MATLNADRYLDAAACTAGEAWTIANGSRLTIRTDTRVHANAPASMTGSLAAQLIQDGEIFIDAQNVRWLAYNTGTGNVPAIGTTISQGGVSGYLLGVWANYTVAPTAAAAAMPVTGFIKLREANGAFAAGALTGIGASATGVDVAGWLEVVSDQGVDITVPRLGKYKSRGQRFYLDNTTGAVGQVFQVPTNGGGAATYCGGAYVETAPGSGVYDFWTGLNGVANGWRYDHIGQPRGATDKRVQFLKELGTGQMQMSENVDVTGTYATTATIAATYADIATTSCFYLRSGGECLVYVAAGHSFHDGLQVYHDFTSGAATTQDGTYTVTVIDAYYYTIPLAGVEALGLVTLRPGVTVTFTAHGLGMGDQVYLDFTTGTGVDGLYTITAPSTNTFNVSYPHAAALTGGNVTVHWGTTITTGVAHNLAIGNLIKCDFTTGTGVDGTWPICTVPSTTTLTINYPFFGLTGGNVTMQFQLGHVAPAGCKVWVPNILLRQCATGTRATNAIAHATTGSRPEFITTSAGAIDMEYAGGDWFFNFLQPFSVRLRNCVVADRLYVGECASAVDVDTLGIGGVNNIATDKFALSTNFAGGIVNNVTAMYASTPTTSMYALSVTACSGGFSFDNIKVSGSVQFVRTTSNYAINIANCEDLTFTNTSVGVGRVNIATSATSFDLSFINTDYYDRHIGYTNSTSAWYGVIGIGALCDNIVVDGLTYGFGGTIPNVHSQAGGFVDVGGNNVTVRNIGTRANPISLGTWRPNIHGQGNPVYLSSIGANIRHQRIYATKPRSASPIYATNSNQSLTLEKVIYPSQTSQNTVTTPVLTVLDAVYKSCGHGPVSVTGQSSVYGVHFIDYFMGSRHGRYDLLMNEPTESTAAQFSIQSGSVRFNSSGGVVMYTVGNQATWEDVDFHKGHTGFMWEIPQMDGGTSIRNYDIHYQIDLGSGFSAWKNYCVYKDSGAGTIGQFTMTMTSTAGIEVGDYVIPGSVATLYGGYKAKVTQINNGTTITVDVANLGTFSATNLYFTRLPSETVDPSIGFKLKIRVTTIATSAAAISMLRAWTTTSIAAQDLAVYPLDTFTLTIAGFVSGSDVVIYAAGTTTVLGAVDAIAATSWGFVYETPQAIDIGVFKPGYVPFYIRNYTLPSSDASVPVALTFDRNYAA